MPYSLRNRFRLVLCLPVLTVLIVALRGFAAPAPAALALKASANSRQANDTLPIIFFDLGNVLIDTHAANSFRYVVGAPAYLNALASKGYTLGLISNIPESWGSTQDEKFAKLKSYVAQSWTESAPFPWEMFTYVLLPPNDSLRKPNPYLFNQALNLSGKCAPAYEGESTIEIAVAGQLGFFAYLTTPGQTKGTVNFAPLNELYCRPRQAPKRKP